MPDIVIAPLDEDKFDDWIEANIASRGASHMPRLLRFLQEMEEGNRLIWAAWDKEEFVGHITLQIKSEYPGFYKGGIPEIVDVWVEEKARKRQIGRRLLRTALRGARNIKAFGVGLGVGVTREYGPAHRLYASEGFMPDGMGIWVNGHQAQEHERVTLTPGSLMMWIKIL